MTEQRLLEIVNLEIDPILKDTVFLREAVKVSYRRYRKDFMKIAEDDIKIKKVIKLIKEDAQQYYSFSKDRSNKQLTGKSDSLKAELLFESVMPYVNEIRKELFGDAAAPFDDMEAARQWIEELSNKPLSDDIIQKKNNFQQIYAQYMDMVKKGQVIGNLGLSQKILDYPGKDGWVYRVISTYSKELSILERAVAQISKATGFHPASITDMILTGDIPEYPRYYVNIKENHYSLPTGEALSRSTVDISINVSDLSFNEIKAIYDYYRDSLKVTGKKRINEKQKTLLAFIDESGQQPPTNSKGSKSYWENMRKKWNKEYPGNNYPYKNWEGIRKAYLGALEKLKI